MCALSKWRIDPTVFQMEVASPEKVIGWQLEINGALVRWTNEMDRVRLIRAGLPYESIEVISDKAEVSIKHMLQLLGVPQTTYNKKKRDQELLNGRDTEVVLVLAELLDYGLEVFNQEEEKWMRWLKKPNGSLGGVKPESLFDSVTGIQEVKNCLNRLAYGQLA